MCGFTASLKPHHLKCVHMNNRFVQMKTFLNLYNKNKSRSHAFLFTVILKFYENTIMIAAIIF